MDTRCQFFVAIVVCFGQVIRVKADNYGIKFQIDADYGGVYCSADADVQDQVISDLFCAQRCSQTDDCNGFFFNTITTVCSTVKGVPETINECQTQDGSLYYKRQGGCDEAPVVDNSLLQSTLGNGEPGTVLTYSCQNGYGSPANKNNYTVTCLNGGNWANVGFECKKDCSEPSTMDHATLGDGETLEGTVRTYTCLTNYVTATGLNTISVTCTNTGEWTSPAETCLKTCGVTPTVSNSVLQSTVGTGIPGTVLTYSCNEGYVAPDNSNDFTVTCGATGEWTEVNFECKKDCSDPSDMNNATLNLGDTLDGAERIYTCINGYITNAGTSTITITCTSTGQWSTVSAICLKSCGTPPSVEHGLVESGTVHEGSVRTYTCDALYSVKLNGVVLAGSLTGDVTCQSSGEWDSIECVLHIACGVSPTVSNAVLQSTVGDGTPGTVLTYSCNQGYEAPANNNDFTLTCGATGEWTEVNFECKKDCSDPSEMNNATLNLGDTLDGAERIYTCFNGYITNTGTSTITTTCTSTGQWSTVSAECLKSCGNPPAVEHGLVEPGTVHEGSVRTYTCDALYSVKLNGVLLAGSLTGDVTCQSSGEWDSVECVLHIVCTKPIALVTGTSGISDNKITASSTLFGFTPSYGRLDNARAWLAANLNLQQYIQYEFENIKIVKEIITQGCAMNFNFVNSWVTSYKIHYSADCQNFGEYNQTFAGNNDISGHVGNLINPAILAKCVRVYPQTWDTRIGMRVELMGCST